jgi:isopentenyl phosphate kinase
MSCVKSALKAGFTPLFHGDVVEDERCGFSICSGDQLLSYLSTTLPVRRAIFLTDVEGVFNENPKENKSARLLMQMKKKEAKAFAQQRIGTTSFDVTNAMAGKLGEIAKMPCPVLVCNGLRRGNLLRALRGENVGTTIY